jgi:DNA-directed RNA polymerase subunit beta
LRPISLQSNKYLDLLFNPFGVYSRMNDSQIIEGIIAKNVMFCDSFIRNNPNKKDNIIEILNWLNTKIIKNMDCDIYCGEINEFLTKMKSNETIFNQFINNVIESNLFIEAPQSSKIRIKELVSNSVPIVEKVKFSKKLLDYMKKELNIKSDLIFSTDIEIDIFCAPIYTMKLNKLVSHIINARDFGPCNFITKQPLKGRANKGGSKVGQMELEGILAHGTMKAFKEIMTVKSDSSKGKPDLLEQLIRNCRYEFPEFLNEYEGGTKKVITKLIQYLED